jgi:hypothetical protein
MILILARSARRSDEKFLPALLEEHNLMLLRSPELGLHSNTLAFQLKLGKESFGIP